MEGIKRLMLCQMDVFGGGSAQEPTDSETGVESGSVAEDEGMEDRVSANQETGVNHGGVAGSRQEVKAEAVEKAFAKRLADAQSKWQNEMSTKYQGYEDYKFIADYMKETNQMDVAAIKEQIELERLQREAQKRDVPVDVMRRLNELEVKAQRADELERMRQTEMQEAEARWQEQQRYAKFREGLEAFAKEKELDADALHQFMYDNQIGSVEAAYKAMKHDDLAKQISQAGKQAVSSFIKAKSSIPNAVSGQVQASKVAQPARTIAEATRRAEERLRNMRDE